MPLSIEYVRLATGFDESKVLRDKGQFAKQAGKFSDAGDEGVLAQRVKDVDHIPSSLDSLPFDLSEYDIHAAIEANDARSTAVRDYMVKDAVLDENGISRTLKDNWDGSPIEAMYVGKETDMHLQLKNYTNASAKDDSVHGDGYKSLNSNLRRGKELTEGNLLTDAGVQAGIAAHTATGAGVPPVVWRGAGDKVDPDDFTAGEVIHWPAYASASTTPDTPSLTFSNKKLATKYSPEHFTTPRVVFEIIPKAGGGVSMGHPNTNAPAEHEYVMNKGSKYRVLGKVDRQFTYNPKGASAGTPSLSAPLRVIQLEQL